MILEDPGSTPSSPKTLSPPGSPRRNGQSPLAFRDYQSPPLERREILGDIMDWLGDADLGDADLVDGYNVSSSASPSPRARTPARTEQLHGCLVGSGSHCRGDPPEPHGIGPDRHRPPTGREQYGPLQAGRSSSPSYRPQGKMNLDLPSREHLRLTLWQQAASAEATTPQFRGRGPKKDGDAALGYCGLTGEKPANEEPEDDEWDLRQQQTGAAGRLVIYEEGDRPQQDLMLRGGGSGNRKIMVVAVTECGKAAMAGVKAGDVLSSIDGKKDFLGLPADGVLASLRAPVMLVFLGFVGKLQAEVRLNYKQKLCGLSSRHQVTLGRAEECMELVDEVVFTPLDELTGRRGMSTLFLATTPPNTKKSAMASTSCQGSAPAGDEDSLSGGFGFVSDNEEMFFQLAKQGTGTSSGSNQRGSSADAAPLGSPRTREEASRPTAAFYELHGGEARTLVSRALSKLQVMEKRRGPHLGPGDDSGQVQHVQQIGVLTQNPNSWRPMTTKLQLDPASAVYLGADHAQAPRAIMPAPSPFAARGEGGPAQQHGTSVSSLAEVCSTAWLSAHCETD